ncbi:hypothetical protein PVAND_000486 [Polypedilum vanderplanki]|uniref:Nose resistant-to-fluoxetine protein N-terminal domain-containing protein n=1 Tax=Polypedilum vanderplanki TaxID=319348 RepID=A0A9J6BKG0_POLVA|nr:hypothetical protein PVAND_000486 [Polypedilum vanderplanki]
MKFSQIFVFLFLNLLNLFETQENFIKNHSLILPQSKNYNYDELCRKQLLKFSQALIENQDWAIRLFDTWAKIQASYLRGNSMNVGDFHSCVKFRYDEIQGQHCLVTFSALTNSTSENDVKDFNLKTFANLLQIYKISPTNGFCLPASCSTENVVEFLNQEFLLQNDLVAIDAKCKTNNIAPLDLIDYFSITIYEITSIKRNKNINKLFISFSIYTNGAKLFDVTKIKTKSSLNCLHGLKALSILWIILGHRFDFQNLWLNSSDYRDFLKTPLSSIIKTHQNAVDTFLVIGGLLMTWSTLKHCEKNNLNILRMIWKRYLRLTPVLAAIILFVISFEKFLITGPFDIDFLKEPCLKNWWMALLHIQNYLDFPEMCIIHSWYLSLDFQLFFISSFIIYLIYKFGKKFLAIPAFLCLVSIIYSLIISFIFDARLRTVKNGEGFFNYMRLLYFQTQSRASPWFIGMIFGYFLYFNSGKTLKINKLINGFLWILAISVIFGIVLLQQAFYISKFPSTSAHAFFIAFEKNIWALAICWIIFACEVLKTGSIVRWLLSLPQWQPISRMSLSMYIIGLVYQIFVYSNQLVPMVISFWNVLPAYWSDIFGITFFSAIFYLAFEAPPILIEEYFHKKSKKLKCECTKEGVEKYFYPNYTCSFHKDNPEKSSTFDFEFYYRKPLTKFWTTASLETKIHDKFQPLFSIKKMEICKELSNMENNKNPLFVLIYKTVQDVLPDLVHPCPYSEFVVHNVTFDMKFVPTYMRLGEYRLIIDTFATEKGESVCLITSVTNMQ